MTNLTLSKYLQNKRHLKDSIRQKETKDIIGQILSKVSLLHALLT